MREHDIRKILRDTTLKKFIDDNRSKVVDELNVPITRSRIDIAVLNGHFHGFEIKSARDTLNRLPHQIDGYSKVFDYLTIVTEEKYHERILDMIPNWIGLQVCENKGGSIVVNTVRKSTLNKQKEGFFIAKLLWREELIEVLRENKIPFKSKDTVWSLCVLLSENVKVRKLSQIVRERLKQRDGWKIKEYYSSE
ncbi:sce7726 family protein [Flagellimonas lutimaris]|uniref:sce7726 family protein n=1 Tax=Flagellimonas lutimaris TaxID=475082 RepID=UPI0039C29CFA